MYMCDAYALAILLQKVHEAFLRAIFFPGRASSQCFSQAPGPPPLWVGTPLLCTILRAWTSEILWTSITTSKATLTCVPVKAFLLV
jgi:hypothetical protein